jgi:hypothetical protein
MPAPPARYNAGVTRWLSLLLVLPASHAIACSGPGAWKAMRDADVFASWSALCVGVLLVPTAYLLARCGHPILGMIHLGLIVFHPSWTVSAWHGDCGSFKVFAAKVFLGLAVMGLLESVAVAVFWQRPWPWRRVRRGFCSGCGYDLRATPERCPECGMVAESSG